ncbi:NADH dehydrogenase [Fervidicella metallireducens AeB]|uniref:NADH dehydrogenase n=1 Tax=Fervidicella metallireducens AeB TaxID=1403537 RepID=A0A017RXX2_9CLOT|nr:nitroreductase family protein [Fervidicella metallireducens]EYE89512.1 NADH dehydrogenase [Fervidicella metallireducens AeB]
MKVIFNRRSIRKYKDRPVENEKVDKLLRAAMQAPSAGNQQPWEFIVVQEKDNLKKLSGMSPYSKLIADAPVAFVLLANEDRMKFPENWQQDMGAAAQNILLEAVELGLGAVWLGVAPLEDRVNYVKKMFNLQDTLKPYCVIALGYPAEGEENKFIDRYDETRVHFEKF